MAIHPSAVIENGAHIGEGVEVGPFSYIAYIFCSNGVFYNSQAVLFNLS